MTTTRSIAVLALCLAASGGCAPDAPESGAEAPAAESSVPAPPAASESPALTDPQIAHVAVTANTIDVETARLAESRSETPEVRDFAQTMITDHTAVNERATALAQRLGVTPEDNSVSRSLQESADEARAHLSELSGETFDRAYLEREVEYHQAVLDALDGALIPGTANADLRGLLQEVRPAIAAHLEHARRLLLLFAVLNKLSI